MIKKIKLFPGNINDEKIVEDIKEKFINNGFLITDSDFDLGVAIGGDGAFLHMVKSCNFNSDIYYVGINLGTLGFLQEVTLSNVDEFINELKNSLFKEEKIGIQNTVIETNDKVYNYNSLNEIIIYDENLKMLKLDIKIDDDLLENFVGDGMLVATSLGSTAHNLSFKGSIVYNTFSSLQITPIAPINSKVYDSLVNSVIVPDKKYIEVIPKSTNDLLIVIDGTNYLFKNVKSIKTVINDKSIKMLRFSYYNFSQKINEKLLG